MYFHLVTVNFKGLALLARLIVLGYVQLVKHGKGRGGESSSWLLEEAPVWELENGQTPDRVVEFKITGHPSETIQFHPY